MVVEPVGSYYYYCCCCYCCCQCCYCDVGAGVDCGEDGDDGVGCVDGDDGGAGGGGGGRVMLDRCPWLLLLRLEQCLPWLLQQLYSLWPFLTLVGSELRVYGCCIGVCCM